MQATIFFRTNRSGTWLFFLFVSRQTLADVISSLITSIVVLVSIESEKSENKYHNKKISLSRKQTLFTPQKTSTRALQWRIQDFPDGGTNPKGGDGNLLFWPGFFPETCMKMKRIGPRERGRILGVPLPQYIGMICVSINLTQSRGKIYTQVVTSLSTLMRHGAFIDYIQLTKLGISEV